MSNMLSSSHRVPVRLLSTARHVGCRAERLPEGLFASFGFLDRLGAAAEGLPRYRSFDNVTSVAYLLYFVESGAVVV
jgi:hypothetical protein